jgi:hypothetical protein
LVAIAERALAWIGDPPRRTSSTAPTVSSLVSAQEQLPEDLRERVLRRATDWLETNAKSEAAPNVAAGLCFAAKDDPKVRSTLVDWALAARTPGALRKFLSMFFRFCGPEDKLLAIAKSLLQEGGSAGRRADLLCGLVQAYPHEPEIAALALAHLSAPRPPLGPEICRYWLRHASAPHEIVRHFLGLSGGVSLMVKWSPVVGCVQEAFARNISEVLRALPELDEKERAATLLRLRYGISRRAEAAKALLAQLEEWPAQYSGVLFRSLLESTIPTAEFAPRLYLSLERRDMAPDQYRETLMGLAARSIRDAELVAGLPANVRRRVDEMAARLRSAELSKAFG